MLSLSPRFDLFRFMLPDTFLPEDIKEKYNEIINRDPSVYITPLEYLNESIVGISLPGISEINIDQTQTSTNGIIPTNKSTNGFGKINKEPSHQNTYIGTSNPLDKIEKDFTVTFRRNQGLYNYYMIYETIFHRICKPNDYKDHDDFKIFFTNGEGVAVSYVQLFQCHIDGIEGLNFEYTKTDRENDTFQVRFKFNNIDFNFIDIEN